MLNSLDPDQARHFDLAPSFLQKGYKQTTLVGKEYVIHKEQPMSILPFNIRINRNYRHYRTVVILIVQYTR